MRIYKMTATFGKLEQAVLELQPGLNVITAPNEWGKSTWCAFLIAMLYGVDTKAKTTRNTLADKDRYAPWSGSPMAGRIDLNWNGRDITIERRTARRIPMGEFRAYETESGVTVSELTAANCDHRRKFPFHQMLLNGELPDCIGGGIGQSRLCMLMMGCAHIGEVQASIWDAATADACEKAGIPLL